MHLPVILFLILRYFLLPDFSRFPDLFLMLWYCTLPVMQASLRLTPMLSVVSNSSYVLPPSLCISTSPMLIFCLFCCKSCLCRFVIFFSIFSIFAAFSACSREVSCFRLSKFRFNTLISSAVRIFNASTFLFPL